MEKSKEILRLEHIVFDSFSFERLGFLNDNKLELNLKIEVGVSKQIKETFLVALILTGQKADEYNVFIRLTGYFNLVDIEDIPKNILEDIMHKNTVAILIPYIRSQLSLITSQPETLPFLLPVLNIDELVNSCEVQKFEW